MTTRIGDLVSQAELLASTRQTIAANLRLWVNITFPTIAPPPTQLDLLGLVDQLADLLARHEVTALVLTEVATPPPIDPITLSLAGACELVCRALAGRTREEQRRIVDAALVLAAPPKASGAQIQQAYRAADEEQTALDNRRLKLSVKARNRMLDGDLDLLELEFADAHGLIDETPMRIRAEIYAATTVVQPRPSIVWKETTWKRGTAAPAAIVRRQSAPLAEQLAELEVLARQLGYTMVLDSEVHDPGEVTLCDEGGSHTYTGTPAECTAWLDEICPGCLKRAHASETDDNGYHPECLARVKGAMDLGSAMSPPEPMVPVTSGQTAVINPGPQTTKD